MTRTKNNHYIPQVHLREWRLDKNSHQDSRPYLVTITNGIGEKATPIERNVAAQNYLYSQALEDSLAEKTDAPFPKAMEALRYDLRNDKIPSSSQEEVLYWKIYLDTLLLRHRIVMQPGFNPEGERMLAEMKGWTNDVFLQERLKLNLLGDFNCFRFVRSHISLPLSLTAPSVSFIPNFSPIRITPLSPDILVVYEFGFNTERSELTKLWPQILRLPDDEVINAYFRYLKRLNRKNPIRQYWITSEVSQSSLYFKEYLLAT